MGLPTFSLPLLTITRSFLLLKSSTLYTYLYHSLVCMPLLPQPYPSFTMVLSSAPFAPFAANDNMRLPVYRTSHVVRFHPYSRAHPSLHQERLMVRLSPVLQPCSTSTTPIRPLSTIIFQSLLWALFEAWHQFR